MSDAHQCQAVTRKGERCVRDGVFRRDGHWLCTQHARIRKRRSDANATLNVSQVLDQALAELRRKLRG